MTPPHSHATRARTSSSSTRARCSGSSGGSDSSSALQRSVNVRVTKLMRFGVKMAADLDIKGTVLTKTKSHYPIMHMPMESRMKFRSWGNISGASQQNSIAAFSTTADVAGDLF